MLQEPDTDEMGVTFAAMTRYPYDSVNTALFSLILVIKINLKHL